MVSELDAVLHGVGILYGSPGLIMDGVCVCLEWVLRDENESDEASQRRKERKHTILLLLRVLVM